MFRKKIPVNESAGNATDMKANVSICKVDEEPYTLKIPHILRAIKCKQHRLSE